MTTLRKDPLLAIARILLILLMGVFIIGMAGIVIGLPSLAIWNQTVTESLVADGAPAQTIWVIAALLVLAGGALYMAFLFVRHMKRIVETVADGDPFIPENARRLTSMAWLMLAIQLVAIPIAAMGIYISSVTEGADAEQGHGFELNGLILVLVLFILARVFRKGAEMREDLEGTI